MTPVLASHPSLSASPLSRRRLVTLMASGAGATALAGCAGDGQSQYSAYVVDSDGQQISPRGAYKKLAKDLARLRQESGAGNVSVSLFHYGEESTFVFSPDYRGYEASTVKVPLALTAMRQAFAQSKRLEQSLQEQIKASISFSDNDATIGIFGSLGKTDEERLAEMNRTYDLLGISQTRANAGWGANLTGTEDHLRISRAVYEGVNWIGAEDMDLLRSAMNASDPASQGWGIGALAKLSGPGADSVGVDAASRVLCKNGWLPNDLGEWYINSDGVVQWQNTTLAISLMLSGFKEQVAGQHVCSQVSESIIRNLLL